MLVLGRSCSLIRGIFHDACVCLRRSIVRNFSETCEAKSFRSSRASTGRISLHGPSLTVTTDLQSAVQSHSIRSSLLASIDRSTRRDLGPPT